MFRNIFKILFCSHPSAWCKNNTNLYPLTSHEILVIMMFPYCRSTLISRWVRSRRLRLSGSCRSTRDAAHALTRYTAKPVVLRPERDTRLSQYVSALSKWRKLIYRRVNPFNIREKGRNRQRYDTNPPKFWAPDAANNCWKKSTNDKWKWTWTE